jgi:protein TonB
MRTYTLAFSVVVHLLAAALIVITPIVANGVLPQPRRAFDFIVVRPVDPPSAPPPPLQRQMPRTRATAGPAAAPLEAPNSITPESGIDRFETSPPGVDGGVPHTVPGDGSAALRAGDPVPPPPPPAEKPLVRVGGSIRPPQKTRHVVPLYPELARAARKQGIVILEAVIGEDGRVRSLRLLRSIPLLDEAAVDAVRQWQFTPTLLNGEPVPVVMTVTVGFVLNP